jgi:hypothetical protein
MDYSGAPAYAPINDWCALSGMGRTVVYECISRGDLRAVKCGKRTLIDVAHGLAFMRSLPEAKVRMGRAV